MVLQQQLDRLVDSDEGEPILGVRLLCEQLDDLGESLGEENEPVDVVAFVHGR